MFPLVLNIGPKVVLKLGNKFFLKVEFVALPKYLEPYLTFFLTLNVLSQLNFIKNLNELPAKFFFIRIKNMRKFNKNSNY